jgi:hypothetical protein
MGKMRFCESFSKIGILMLVKISGMGGDILANRRNREFSGTVKR